MFSSNGFGISDYDADEIFPAGIDIPEPDSRKSFSSTFGGEKSGVYKITNNLNSKFYIGSSKAIAYRWGCHISALTKGKHGSKHFQNFFNKYREIHFKIEVLEECEPSKRFEREQFYLDHLQPFGEKGFNMQRTVCRADWGTKKDSRKIIYQYNKLGLVGEFSCASHAAEFLGVNFETRAITLVAEKKEKTYRGFIFSYEELSKEELDKLFLDKRTCRFNRPNYRQGIKRSLKNGESVIYKSVAEASSQTGYLSVCINRACRKGVLYKGCVWEYLPNEKEKSLFPKKRPFGAFNENGELVHAFKSGVEARYFGFDRNSIILCRKNGKKHKGLYWRYLE
jgi:group I intron endonuclease